VAALRVLEGDGATAPSEIDLVGRWLADEWAWPHAEPEGASARRWWPALAAALMAALVVLWVSPLRDPGATSLWWEGRDDGWQARGGSTTGALAVEALCVADRPGATAEPAHSKGCGHDELLGFAYRVAPEVSGRLTLFGIDSDGDPMFYLPTPVDADTPTVDPGRWRALPLAVRLSVNHAPGPLRIYSLVAPRAPTIDEVRAWVEKLDPQSTLASGDGPWIERVPADSLSRICPSITDCHAAELRLTVTP